MTDWTQRDSAFAAAWEQCAPYTMTSAARGYALWLAVGHVVREQVPGCMIECGTWKGGSAMLILLAARHFGWKGTLFLFDTFSGMTEPGKEDVDYKGNAAFSLMEKATDKRETALIWAYASLDEVRRNVLRFVTEDIKVYFIKGPVEETLSQIKTGVISLLRLDTDFYESTACEMANLYPKLCRNGVIFIDDYGHWQGAQKAVDEYIEQMQPGSRPFLVPVDYTGRIAIKPPTATRKVYDFIPNGFSDPQLLEAFPSLQISDPTQVKWPWLRRNSPHIWRTDSRSKKANIGVLSYEEALILYNYARQFGGKRGLEVGCHLAWSTVHLLAAGIQLDVIDPALGDEQHLSHVRSSIEAAVGESGLNRTSLYPGFSPGIVDLVSASQVAPWSVAFIDGFHDLGAPLKDARAILPHMAEDAILFFHDLICPDVYEAVMFVRESGWSVEILNTSQVMAVAWRGNVALPIYSSDNKMPSAPLTGMQKDTL